MHFFLFGRAQEPRQNSFVSANGDIRDSISSFHISYTKSLSVSFCLSVSQLQFKVPPKLITFLLPLTSHTHRFTYFILRGKVDGKNETRVGMELFFFFFWKGYFFFLASPAVSRKTKWLAPTRMSVGFDKRRIRIGMSSKEIKPSSVP